MHRVPSQIQNSLSRWLRRGQNLQVLDRILVTGVITVNYIIVMFSTCSLITHIVWALTQSNGTRIIQVLNFSRLYGVIWCVLTLVFNVAVPFRNISIVLRRLDM